MVMGVADAKRYIQLANTCNALLLNAKYRIFISVRHVFSHAGNVGNECADIAASCGTHGSISEFNNPARWPERGFRVRKLFQNGHS